MNYEKLASVRSPLAFKIYVYTYYSFRGHMEVLGTKCHKLSDSIIEWKKNMSNIIILRFYLFILLLHGVDDAIIVIETSLDKCYWTNDYSLPHIVLLPIFDQSLKIVLHFWF